MESEPFNSVTQETKIMQKLEFETPEARPANAKPRRKGKLDYGKARQNETAPKAEKSKKQTKWTVEEKRRAACNDMQLRKKQKRQPRRNPQGNASGNFRSADQTGKKDEKNKGDHKCRRRNLTDAKENISPRRSEKRTEELPQA